MNSVCPSVRAIMRYTLYVIYKHFGMVHRNKVFDNSRLLYAAFRSVSWLLYYRTSHELEKEKYPNGHRIKIENVMKK